MNKKRILITTGGTGGHVFPACALAQQLRQKYPNVDLLFVGGGLSHNLYFNRSNFPYEEIPCGTYSSNGMLQKVVAGGKILKGVKKSLNIIKDFKPDAVVGFGSYYTAPVLAAAKLKSVPMVLHEGNSIPGRTTKYFSKYAVVTGLNIGDTARYLKGRTIDVGMPLREGFTSIFASREKAADYFHLDPNTFTFLVFGGSQGALVLNMAFGSAITELSGRTTNYQIIHLTGSKGTAEEMKRLYNDLNVCSCVRDFEDRMDQAWICSDLVISRAGALSMAEQIEFEVPGILVPYPKAVDNHQDKNADFMANIVGGAIKMPEKVCTGENIVQAVDHLIADDRAKLKQMQTAIKNYKKRQKRRDLFSVVCEVAGLKVR